MKRRLGGVAGRRQDVAGKLRDAWGKWRASRRQYQLERALYKAGGNPTGSPSSRINNADRGQKGSSNPTNLK